MARFLIVYGTTDGQTARVAEFVGHALLARGQRVDVIKAGTVAIDPAGYDAVLVAASIQAGHYQRPVVRWVREHAAALGTKPNAFLSVCLAILERDPKARAELEKITGRFVATTGWAPGEVKFVAGALRYTRYGLIKRIIMRRIARKAGGALDISRDHEYTDWSDLENFTARFVAKVMPGVVASAERPAATAGVPGEVESGAVTAA